MKKILLPFLVALPLLTLSGLSSACSVNVTVVNNSHKNLRNVSVKGPYGRPWGANQHNMTKNGDTFEYAASGLGCHGDYSLISSFDYFSKHPKQHMPVDGNATAVIDACNRVDNSGHTDLSCRYHWAA